MKMMSDIERKSANLPSFVLSLSVVRLRQQQQALICNAGTHDKSGSMHLICFLIDGEVRRWIQEDIGMSAHLLRDVPV